MSLDDELLAAAKALAARRGTTVTAMVRSALEQSVATGAMGPPAPGAQSFGRGGAVRCAVFAGRLFGKAAKA